MFIYKCTIDDKKSDESLILTIDSSVNELPDLPWTGWQRNTPDWEMVEEIINDSGYYRCSIYVVKDKKLAYIESTLELEVDKEIEFFKLGGLKF